MLSKSAWATLPLAVIVSTVVTVSNCLEKDELYRFGLQAGDSVLPGDREDVSSPEVTLETRVWFYGEFYDSAFINSNGLISFLTEFPNYINIAFPLNYPNIAAFYSDVDTRSSGNVYYRETTEPDLLDRAAQTISQYFSDAPDFLAKSLLIATWEDVGYFEAKSDKTNTFQAVVASDGITSFVILLYPMDGLKWSQSEGKNPHMPDARAQVGLTSGRGSWYTLQESGTEQVVHIDKRSNVGEPGVWVLQIGSDGEDDIRLPDLGSEIDEETIGTCEVGKTYCNSKASCVEYAKGFCCYCSGEYYGNGRTCLPKEKPLRLTGKVDANLNGIVLEQQVFDAYIVTIEGRAYSGVSKVPRSIGSSIQLLSVVDNMIGWLFAQPQGSAPNGFELTGGVFNYTAEVIFPNTGDKVDIEAHFPGVDVFDYLRVHLTIRGTLPMVPSDATIELRDFSDDYTHVARGELVSKSNRVYKVENERPIPVNITQRISYSPCFNEPEKEDKHSNLVLEVSRNYIVYDSRDEIVRYASTQKILPGGTGDDPCQNGEKKCGPNSSCIVIGNSFDCACHKGFQYESPATGVQPQCTDVNECITGRDNCHEDALCFNLPGSFRCQCKSGFHGNGVYCQKINTCENLQCAENAHCVAAPYTGQPVCVCMPGYHGDGSSGCHKFEAGEPRPNDPRSCGSNRHDCSPAASCVYKPEINDFFCTCHVGHTGDGLSCLPDEEPVFIGPPPTCVMGICNCPHNFYLEIDTNTCLPDDVYPPEIDVNTSSPPTAEASCEEVNICSENADCMYEHRAGKFKCVCKEGYEGDGLVCTAVGQCTTNEDCHENATCRFDYNSAQSRCACNNGFQGNGVMCKQIPDAGCNIIDICDEHATCRYDMLSRKYRCSCNEGYTGDGIYCSPNRLPCAVDEDCGEHGECIGVSSAYGSLDSLRCQCSKGFRGDGYDCKPAQSCYDNPAICHRDAVCVPGPGGLTHSCWCNQGFEGNGFECTEVMRPKGEVLFVAQGMTVLKVPFEPSPSNPGVPILLEPLQTSVAIDADCLRGKIYYGDVSGGAIVTAGFDGGEKSIFANKNITSPEGIAVDWMSKLIYWTDSGQKSVDVAVIQTGRRKRLISTELINPRGIAVHSRRMKIYWSDWNRDNPKIEEADQDGSRRRILVRAQVQLPGSLAVDMDTDELCWADSGHSHIACLSLTDGASQRIITTAAPRPFGLSITSATYYWTDWEKQAIMSLPKRNMTAVRTMPVPFAMTARLYGVAAVPAVCPTADAPSLCTYENGGCEDYQICVPNAKGSRNCLCADEPQDGDPPCNPIIEY